MDLHLNKRTAIVTGGSVGLGRALVLSLVKEGVNVCFTWQRDEARATQLIAEVKSAYDVEIIAVNTDLSDEKHREHLVSTCIHQLGNVDILINNAAIWLSGYVREIASEDWDRVMNVNLKAVFHLSQLFVNHCEAKGQPGTILNITSQAAFHGSTTGHAHYAASKAGLVAFSISLAREVAQQNINVNNLAVGIMDTDMIRKNIEQDPNYYLSRIPVGRVAQPEEIADIGVFMVSPKTRYMTGATIDVTGGMLMR
ncbi:TPA: SDR family NAD(P)-dependent oxidoreductase [Pluralibacter gergoviae]|uniref:3-oxoacyl-ACP reductase n=1 Tax=Pluralibacter gergoviae TaxID=61647 RepID=A0A089R7Y6_PLUGE|nr:SDR family NAD(P)-dependent oxidoreductase [Pluralibacter gergoviae]AIR02710.1 3-oxoacyl-ACP reductase [Pluralibacter gergoviae]EKV0930164.1 SDR family NAD(P)-dependent oxidoreductase [Pluralibacter gergoviae]EKV6248921.1 SDR family NAD(P)-dependent oxidoreductase [Pluralibacter gergoviae]EKW6618712.1 SDR family NAD(P)-dependent oxidoreductase [Pluralibacter gergoviae]EKW9965597.1 SDR family NAD(P)-dependent oxidoreductase [Pluralibacter gergoviae]